MGIKTCSRCLQSKGLINSFYPNSNICKDCKLEYNRKRRTSSIIKKQNVKARYGITTEEYEKHLEAECCQICNVSFDKKFTKCLDHCHKENLIRGVLCTECNIGLGMFKDNMNYLQNALNYLHKWQVTQK